MQRLKRPVSRMQLQTKIILSVSILLLAVILLLGTFFAFQVAEIVEQQIGNQALQVSRIVSHIPEIKTNLKNGDPAGNIQQIAERIRIDTEAEFVVVGDNQTIRYSHPDPTKLGQKMVGGDSLEAIQTGHSYVSKAIGTLGPSIRGKVPIKEGTNVIGIVSVGYLLEDVHTSITLHQKKIIFLAFLFLLAGVIVSIRIASNIKNAIFGLEPWEIAKLFQEKTAILESMRTGLFGVDSTGIITTVNRAAREALPTSVPQELEGKPIAEIFPKLDIQRFLRSGKQRHMSLEHIGGDEYVVHQIILRKGDEPDGAVVSFRKKDDMYQMAEELSKVKEYSKVLRAQTHEYLNKLHMISGLIQQGNYDEAQEIISLEASGYGELLETLPEIISESRLSALLLGKYAYAREKKVTFSISPDSSLHNIPQDISIEKLITILGNVLDNAFDAARANTEKQPQVTLFMTDLGDDLLFEIEDSGTGISPENFNRIFQAGFTTKDSVPVRGMGLYMVKQAVDELQGTITLEHGELGGALFVIAIPK